VAQGIGVHDHLTGSRRFGGFGMVKTQLGDIRHIYTGPSQMVLIFTTQTTLWNILCSDCLLQVLLLSSSLLPKQLGNLTQQGSGLIIIRDRVFPGLPGNPRLEAAQAQAQQSNNNRDEQSGQGHSKGVAFGRLPLHPPLQLVPGRPFASEIVQGCKPLAPVPVLEVVCIVKDLVALNLGTSLVETVLGDEPL
jgi:hypothetical protein